MSQPKTPDPEIPNKQKAVHNPPPHSSLQSETPSTEASNSGGSSQPPKYRPPATGEFGSGNELIPFDSNNLLVVNGRRRNGLILFKRYHAEFAGPGAAVGGVIDCDCQLALPLGNFSLLCPESAEERQRAYALRRQWIRLTNQITNNPDPLQRAQLLLNQFEHYFDAQTMAQLPDDALALLVGVLPGTIRMARSMKT